MNLSKKLDEMLTSRWVLWGISIIVASSMWYYIIGGSGAQTEIRTFPVRVEYLNIDPQITIKGAVSEVMVEVKALTRVLDGLSYDSIVCEMNLQGLSSGKYRPSARPKMPPDVTLISVSPSILDIELVRQVSRVLPVEVTLPQDIPAGQYLEAVEVVPKEINVRGTESDIAKIGSVSIAPTFAELQTGKELMLPLEINRSQEFEDEVIWEPTQVRVNATLVTGMPRKKVPVNVRLLGKPSGDYEVGFITTDPAEVMVQGEKVSLDKISAADTETVDITNLSASQTVVVPLRAFEDKGVSTVNVSSVRLSIRLEPIAAQRLISNVPVFVDGAAGGLKWTAEPSAVQVTVEGPPSVMETLDLSATLQLRAFVDVSGIFLRQAVLPVWAAPASDDFKVVKVEPSTLTVSVAEE